MLLVNIQIVFQNVLIAYKYLLCPFVSFNLSFIYIIFNEQKLSAAQHLTYCATVHLFSPCVATSPYHSHGNINLLKPLTFKPLKNWY